MPSLNNTNPVEALFQQALEIPLARREAFLRQQCRENKELRERVQELLAAHEQTGSFVVDRQAEWTQGASSSMKLGSRIGPYTLREKIGEGGMGEVYVAEQEKPIARKVALKVIKPGMDSKAVLARFEAEQQALAMMNHRNIAKVLDAGLSPSGSPYFVMELVAGMPITVYCDEKKLTIQERLELFIQVCRAIQHAHQKGIIHRDIKPSNVLVTEEDGQAIPKVIDFGVAKALSQKLTERTLYTNFQAFLGTPLYASPEQASLSNVDVDTRSDVYSLGILLYELVTGSTPYNKDELQKAAYEEMCRIIREQEAVKPSTRLTTLGQSATSVSERRRSDPSRLIQSVRGDLDWIVMKSLEKNRGRRYEGANSLAQDIERMLRKEPIEARPPAFLYRFSKTLQRNRIRVAALSLLGTLAICLSIILWQQQRSEEMTGIFEQSIRAKVDGLILSGKGTEAREFLDSANNLGVSDDLVQLLKSQIALFDPVDFASAVSSLEEQKTRRNEPDLALDSMLCRAYQLDGQEEHHVDLLEEILEADAESFEDYLFRGFASSFFFPRRAIEDLIHARQLDPTSHLALLIYSETKRSLGETELEADEAISHLQASLDGLNAVSQYLPSNGLVRSNLAFAYLNMGFRYRDKEQPKLSDRFLALADSEFDSLPLNSQDAFRARSSYYLWMNSLPNLRADYEAAKKTCGVHSYQAVAVAIGDYRLGNEQHAIEALRHTEGKYAAAFELFVQMDRINSRVELEQIFEELLAERKRSESMHGIFDAIVWRLLKNKKRAAESLFRVQRLAEKTKNVAWKKQVEYLYGVCSAKEMFDSATNRFDKVQANFYAAFCALGNNQRELAKQFFVNVVELQLTEPFASQWSQAFLEKIDDPNWLPWIDPIPIKETEDE